MRGNHIVVQLITQLRHSLEALTMGMLNLNYILSCQYSFSNRIRHFIEFSFFLMTLLDFIVDKGSQEVTGIKN